MKILFFILLLSNNTLADDQRNRRFSGSYVEKIGIKQDIYYFAECEILSKSTTCSLRALNFFTKESQMKCVLDSQILFEDQNSSYTNGTWTVVRTDDFCGYTNTYTFSDLGMIQVKSTPKKPRRELCEARPPTTYNAKPVDSSEIKINSHGCNTIKVLGF